MTQAVGLGQMTTIQPDSFDIVVVGTGLEESLIAA